MKIVIGFIFIFLQASCSGHVRGDSRIEDVSQAKVEILRFDRDLLDYILYQDQQVAENLKRKYPLLLSAVGSITIGNTVESDTLFFDDITNFFTHPMLMQIYKDEQARFSNITDIERQLIDAVSISKKLFPDKKFPQFAMHVSGFKENVIVLENLISLSADKYMGGDYPAYTGFFAPYEREQMKPEMIVRDYMKAWLISDVLPEDSTYTLLSSMVEQGELFYVLSLLLPEYNEVDIIGYTPKQFQWCEDNERKIWKALTAGNRLYSSDFMLISKYISDTSYNTSEMPKESPGRVGCWLGWQIVKKYMERTGVSLTDLMKADSKNILKEAKYNP